MGRPVRRGKRRACPWPAGRAVSRPIRLEMRVPRFRPLLFAALLALGLAAAFAAPASAQIREGAYGVEGTNPDGTNYDGEFMLRTGPGGAWVTDSGVPIWVEWRPVEDAGLDVPLYPDGLRELIEGLTR